MKYGMRVSTEDQNASMQRAALKKHGSRRSLPTTDNPARYDEPAGVSEMP